jgi:ABC-type glycerol-3-phosphate transport system permease component
MVAVETKRLPGAAPRPRFRSAPLPRVRPKRSLANRVVILVGSLCFVGFALYPLVYLLSGALKSQTEIYSGFAHLFPKHATLTNFHQLLFINSNTEGI